MSIWVRPIILAMEEAEFGMNMVGGCSRQIVQVTLSWKYPAQNKWRYGSRYRIPD
jgi:hypothetical protein